MSALAILAMLTMLQDAPQVRQADPIQPSAEALTQPGLKYSCAMVDEAFHHFALEITQSGGQGYLYVAPDGKTTAGSYAASYTLTSADVRFRGWTNRENTYDVQGIAFTAPGGLIATVQVQEGVARRLKTSNISVYVSPNNSARTFVRYVGFCDVALIPQQPLAPDQKKAAQP